MLSASRFSLLALLATASCAVGQAPAPAPSSATAVQAAPAQSPARVEIPTDPATWLALAAKKNGLQNLTSAPWHLKAAFEVMDDKGQTTDTGTFEEFWISATKSRSIYSSPSFNRTSIEDEKGAYEQGDTGLPRGAASLVKPTLFHRVIPARDNGRDRVISQNRTLGPVNLKCITIEKLVPPPVAMMGTDCFDDDLPVLRVSGGPSGVLQTLYNQVVLFQGIYIARNIEVKAASKTILHIHIDTLEPYAPKDEGQFTPDPQAVFSPNSVTNSGAVQAGNIVRKVQPEYPGFAKQQRIQGTVVLFAIINKEGKIANLEPICGPRELIRPSVDAVRRWEYSPYLLNGMPVEVETEINVVFALNSR